MADEASETVEGTIKSVVFHNDENGYTVLHVELPSGFALRQLNEITVVGKAQAVWEGEEISATGSWVTDKVHGRQFKAETITCVAPRSLVGIERYLASGLIKGVGKVLAKRIARLVEVPKLGKAKIEQIRASWHANETLRENMIFGQTYGISIAKMTKIVRKYGPDAIAIVKADPYKLCRDIWGIGFATADRIALSVGIPKDSPLRAQASISYTLETEAEDSGHCWTFENDLLLHANELTEIPTEILGDALEKEIAEGRVLAESDSAAKDADATWAERHDATSPRRIYLRSLWWAERETASHVRRIRDSMPGFTPVDAGKAVTWWEQKSGFSLAAQQTNALEKCLCNKFSIITGGPGVGKTTIIRALVDIYGGHRTIDFAVSLPDGRVEVRYIDGKRYLRRGSRERRVATHRNCHVRIDGADIQRTVLKRQSAIRTHRNIHRHRSK